MDKTYNPKIFIPGNVPSSKNSKQVSTFTDKNGNTRTIVTSSKTVKDYLRSFGIKSYDVKKKTVERYVRIPMTFPVNEIKALFEGKDYPYIVGMHFIRSSKREADFGNLQQILADLFVSFDIIPDDNMKYFFPEKLEIEGKYYSVDKDNAGVIIQVK